MISFNFFVFSFFTHNVLPVVISLIVLFTHIKKTVKIHINKLCSNT